MIKCLGHLEINNGVRILTHPDICKYYQWLIRKYHYNLVKMQTPSFFAHVTLYNPKIHGKKDVSLAAAYKNYQIELELYPEQMHISRVNYWIPVKCEIGDIIKKRMKIDDGDNYYGLHLTVANKKNL